MKKLAVICLFALSANAFCADMLDQIQGKWRVDLAATKDVPETKKALENKNAPSAKFLEVMFATLSKTVYEFRKDSLRASVDGAEGLEEKFTVVKNTNDVLVIKKTDADETIYIYMNGKTIVLRDSEKGKPVKMPPIVLMR